MSRLLKKMLSRRSLIGAGALAGAGGLVGAQMLAKPQEAQAATLLPSEIWVGDLYINPGGWFIYTHKIYVNAPYLTAYTAISEFGFRPTAGSSDFGVKTIFPAYFLSNSPGVQRGWYSPFYSGSSVYAIMVSLYVSVWNVNGSTVAPHQFVVHRPYNVAPAVAPSSIDARPSTGVVIYDTATGKIKMLYRVSNVSGDELPDAVSLEAEARESFRAQSKEIFSMGVLPIDVRQIKREMVYEVDLASRTLKERPV